MGDLRRLRAALQRAEAGQPLTVAAVGASVTSDYGGMHGWMQESFSLGLLGKPARCRGSCAIPGWLLPPLGYLQQVAANASNVRLVNCGMSGHKLSSFSSCMLTKLPAAADIVLVEAASINQAEAREPFWAELLLRRLLVLPHAPAVVLVHVPNWCWYRELNGQDRRRATDSGACYSPQELRRGWREGGRTEFMLDELAAYYGLPALSARRWAPRRRRCSRTSAAL